MPTLVAEPQWQRVAGQEAFANATMLAVAGGPDRYVAVALTRAGNAMTGAIWTSTDGVARRLVSVPSADDMQIDSVIYDRLGYVVWGTSSQADSCPQGPDGGRSCAAIWTSPDGESWTRAPDIPSFHDVEIAGVARLGDDLVALASDLRTWTSRDGLAWLPVSSETSTPWNVSVSGVVAADGALVAWGSAVAGNDGYIPVSLRTTDGRRWEIGGAGLKTEGYMIEGILDVVAADGRLVAVGHGLTGEAGSPPAPSVAWTSTDGLTWTPGEFQPEPSTGSLGHLIWYGGRYVALGSVSATSIERLSVDGRTWTEGASAPDTAIDGEEEGCTGGPCPRSIVTDLAAGPTGLVAVGARICRCLAFSTLRAQIPAVEMLRYMNPQFIGQKGSEACLVEEE